MRGQATADGQAMRGAEEHAMRLLRQVGVQHPPVPATKIARYVGVVALARRPIRSEALLQSVGYMTDEVVWGVILRGDRSVTVQRFSLAHEVGHIVLNAFLRGGRAHERQEHLMEHFAACLL